MTDNQEIVSFFSGKVANEYDLRADRVAPVSQALYFSIYLALRNFGANANILSIGTGTGNEIIFLANQFPEWHFTCIEPAKEMADILRQKITDAKIENRVTIYNGFLSEYKSDIKYDCAITLLVSHFFTDITKRTAFYAEIETYLNDNAILINADISADKQSDDFKALLPIWLNLQRESGMNDDIIAEHILAGMDKNYAVSTPDTIAQILNNAGFKEPTLFYRNILINAWISKKD